MICCSFQRRNRKDWELILALYRYWMFQPLKPSTTTSASTVTASVSVATACDEVPLIWFFGIFAHDCGLAAASLWHVGRRRKRFRDLMVIALAISENHRRSACAVVYLNDELFRPSLNIFIANVLLQVCRELLIQVLGYFFSKVLLFGLKGFHVSNYI